jgi:hypothetical protein
VPTVIRPISYTYVDLVRRVAMGLSIEDGEEMARGLYCIRPHEKFRTHLIGSAWLCYYVMLCWFWAPMYVEIALEQQPDQQRIADYELALQAGVRALNVWKVCRQQAGIVHAFARRAPLTVDADEERSVESWGWLAACAALLLAAVLFWPAHHGPVLVAAFTPFYIDAGTGASDLNAGTTSVNAGGSSAAAFSYAGGTFVRATGVFTVASGNPQTDGVTTGTYASVYTTSGATAATFVAQITARDTTTITVDVTTLKWGVVTSVSEAAAASTLKVSGAWLGGPSPLAAAGLGTFTVPVSTKVNIAGNVSIGASRTISIAGATTAPIWFSGYNTTPGDLDADTTNALAKPIWTFNSTFALTTSGAHQTWSSISLVGLRSGTLWSDNNVGNRVRLRSENTSTNTGADAGTLTSGSHFGYCWFKSLSGTTGTIATATVFFFGCVCEGSAGAGWSCGSSSSVLNDCVSLTATVSGVQATTGSIQMFQCTCYGSSTNGVKWTSTPGTNSSVVACLFSGLNGSTAMTNGVNNASGTNTNLIFRACNDAYNVTNAEVGMGDSPAFFPQTDSNPVVTSATNLTPVASSNAINHGFPGIFENETFNSYASIGAVTPPSGGGGVAIFGG